jgi:hypothetical protein
MLVEKLVVVSAEIPALTQKRVLIIIAIKNELPLNNRAPKVAELTKRRRVTHTASPMYRVIASGVAKEPKADGKPRSNTTSFARKRPIVTTKTPTLRARLD